MHWIRLVGFASVVMLLFVCSQGVAQQVACSFEQIKGDAAHCSPFELRPEWH